MREQDEKLKVPGADESPELLFDEAKTLIIACGALAREILDIMRANDWPHLSITCLPANLHNRPDLIPDRLREKIAKFRDEYERIFIAYADCGTGGLIDKLAAEEGVTRIGGPHCYSFFTGQAAFDVMAEEELGTFYLTDYLVRQFDTLIMEGMGLNRHPELMGIMFGNYKRLVYLAQVEDPDLDRQAEAAAEKLGLRYEKRTTGYGELSDFIRGAAKAGKT